MCYKRSNQGGERGLPLNMMKDETKKQLLYEPHALNYYTICGFIRLSVASLLSLLSVVALVSIALASTAIGIAMSNTGSASSVDPIMFSPPPPPPTESLVAGLDSHSVLFDNAKMFGSNTLLELRLHSGGISIPGNGGFAGRFASSHKAALAGTALGNTTGLFYDNQKIANIETLTETIKGNQNGKNFLHQTYVLEMVESTGTIMMENTCAVQYNSSATVGMFQFREIACVVLLLAMPVEPSQQTPIFNKMLPLKSKALFAKYKNNEPMGDGFNVDGGQTNKTHRRFYFSFYEGQAGASLVPQAVIQGLTGTSIVHVPR